MGQEYIRAFIAAKLDTQSWTALGSVRRDLYLSKIPGVRILPLKNIHLTLKFLGSTNLNMLLPIAASLQTIAKIVEPFIITFDQFGVFPNPRQPKVLWLGPKNKSHHIEDLHHKIDNALHSLGIRQEHRKFSPHLTFARVRSGNSSQEISAIKTAVEKLDIRLSDIRVTGISLIRSELSPAGATYTQLHSLPLRKN